MSIFHMALGQNVPIDEYTRQAVIVIPHIMRNLRHSGMELQAEIELPYSQILMLYALLETGEATMGELSKWLKVTHGVTTRTVDRLVEKGLVERRRDGGPSRDPRAACKQA